MGAITKKNSIALFQWKQLYAPVVLKNTKVFNAE